MHSESARASSAAEARFRINDPNSRPRTVKVVALDRPSQAVVERLAQDQWSGANFLVASAFAAEPQGRRQFPTENWLSDLAGRPKYLLDEINGADLVIMVATAGENASAAAIVGEACSLKRVMTSALVLGGVSATDAALSKTLAQLRPWALMLVAASSDDYIADMLSALRA
jgi:hypothetical protein